MGRSAGIVFLNLLVSLIVAQAYVIPDPRDNGQQGAAGSEVLTSQGAAGSGEEVVLTETAEVRPAPYIPMPYNFEAPEDQRRQKRSADRSALDLALDHSRPVGQVHGFSSTRVSGNNLNNWSASSNRGLGAVVYRSPNRRHSVGVGATYGSDMGRHRGSSWSSRPNASAGVGYSFRF